MGNTKAERDAKIAKFKKLAKARFVRVDAELEELADKGIGTPLEHKERNVQYAKERRKLGFIDMEIDADGNSILAEDGMGVEDPVMQELEIKATKYQKQVSDQRARKKIDIITPVQGISRDEYKEGMLRSDEHFKNM